MAELCDNFKYDAELELYASEPLNGIDVGKLLGRLKGYQVVNPYLEQEGNRTAVCLTEAQFVKIGGTVEKTVNVVTAQPSESETGEAALITESPQQAQPQIMEEPPALKAGDVLILGPGMGSDGEGPSYDGLAQEVHVAEPIADGIPSAANEPKESELIHTANLFEIDNDEQCVATLPYALASRFVAVLQGLDDTHYEWHRHGDKVTLKMDMETVMKLEESIYQVPTLETKIRFANTVGRQANSTAGWGRAVAAAGGDK